MKIYLKEHGNDWHMITNKGWGNGYVILDKSSKYDGVHYDNIPVECHGGLTYANRITKDFSERYEGIAPEDIGKWMIGFDTLHSFSDSRHDRDYVERQCKSIIDQLRLYEIIKN